MFHLDSPSSERQIMIDEAAQSVHLYDPVHAVPVCTYPGYQVTAAAWSPNSQQVALGSAYRTVRVWDGRTGALMASQQGRPEHHRGLCRVTQLAWSPDASRLALACSDGVLTIWQPGCKEPGHSYQAHRCLVQVLAWSPKGEWLAAASSDGVLSVWETKRACVLARWECPLQVNALRWDRGMLSVIHRDMVVQRVGSHLLRRLHQE